MSEETTPELELFGQKAESSKQSGEKYKHLNYWAASRFPFLGNVRELLDDPGIRHLYGDYRFMGSLRLIEGTVGFSFTAMLGGGNGSLAEYAANDPQVVANALTEKAEELLLGLFDWVEEARSKRTDEFDDTVGLIKVYGLKFVRDDNQPNDHVRFVYVCEDSIDLCYWGILLRTGVKNGKRWWRAKPWCDEEDPDGDFSGVDTQAVVSASLRCVQQMGGIPGEDLDDEIRSHIWGVHRNA